MAYDKRLTHRLEEYFSDLEGAEQKRMFGGLCLMLSGHMCSGIVADTLMARSIRL